MGKKKVEEPEVEAEDETPPDAPPPEEVTPPPAPKVYALGEGSEPDLPK